MVRRTAPITGKAAGSGISIKLVGAERLQRMLKDVPAKDAKKAIRTGARAGSKIITAKAKQLAPVRSGAVRRAIRTRAAERRRRYVGTVTRIGAGFFVGKEFYGSFAELGHHVGNRKLGAARKWVEGQSFMRRAASQNKDRAARKAIVIIIREITAAAKRIGGGGV